MKDAKVTRGGGIISKNKLINDRQFRRMLLTLNYPEEKGYTIKKCMEILITKFKSLEYLAIVKEIGENGNPHYHIFCCFSSVVRCSSIKRNFPEIHIDACRGTIEDNLQYLKKSGKWIDTAKAETTVEGTFQEWGTKPSESAGKRKDMQELYQMIADGMSNAEILAINQDYIMQLDKLDKLRNTLLQEKFGRTRRLDLEVVYTFGETGSGKSRSVLDEEGDDRVYRITDYTHPWDGYNNEPVVVFEEFRSNLPLGEMLQLLDIYPMMLRARYANRWACYNKVYIISNPNLESQYPNADEASWNALLRRIHKIKKYKSKDEIIEYNSVAEYYSRNSTFVPVAELPKEEQLSIPFIGKEVDQ